MLDNDAAGNSPDDSYFVPLEFAQEMERENRAMRTLLKAQIFTIEHLEEIAEETTKEE